MKQLIIVVLLLLLHPGGALLSQFSQADMALDLNDALTFHSYPTYDHYLQMMQGFAEDYPALCRLDTFGTTPGGRLLLALKISDNPGEEEAEAPFFYTSTMHGDELPGYVLLLRMADTLLRGYGSDPEIDAVVNGLEIWINPLANPDGAYMAGNHSLTGAIRENAPTEHYPEGRDLNRDFPDPAAGDADDSTGRAPETRSMMDFLHRKGFVMSANIHAGAEVVNYPWDHTYDRHADDDWLRFVSGEYADEAMAVDSDYMFGWPEGGITNGAAWYTTQGSRQDYICYYLEGREVTLELSREKMLPSEELEWIWLVNYRSLLNYMSQGLYGIRGRVSDAESLDPLEARVEVLEHDSFYSMVHSRPEHGDFYRLIAGGTYDLAFSAAGYISDTIRGVEVIDYQATLLDVSLEAGKSNLEQPDLNDYLIWPNPASDHLYIRPGLPLPDHILIRLCSPEGKVLMVQELQHPPELLSLELPKGLKGLYFLRLDSPHRTETFPLFIH